MKQLDPTRMPRVGSNVIDEKGVKLVEEWIKSLIEAQVDITRELTSSYTTAARSLLK